MLEKLFALKDHDTSVRRELVAGLTNFMTISYIIFVQPYFLSAAGMNHGAVMVATCISSALATFLMAFPCHGLSDGVPFVHLSGSESGVPRSPKTKAAALSRSRMR